MKNLLGFTIVLMCLLTVQQSYAQDQIIKTNPLGLAFGNFNAVYEKALNEKSSISVGGSYLYSFLGTDVTGFGLNSEWRYYITNTTKPAPEGFYAGPSFGFNNFSVKDEDGSVSIIGIGGTVGYQWIWDSGVSLDLGAGPQYSIIVAEGEDTSEDFSGFLPRLVFAVGYAFGGNK